MLKIRKLLWVGFGVLVTWLIAETNTTAVYGTPLVYDYEYIKKREKFTFASEAFPYQNKAHYTKYLVYEKMITNTNVETVYMLRRSKEVFKVIEPILKKNNVPDDFKYLAVLESGLNTHITSAAHAKGIWQLMASTARAMGLKVNGSVDERLDLVKSTEAICRLLKSHKRFFGTWTEALVAFNMGNTALFKFQKAQNNYNDIYALRMYVESTHIVYKILAYKELFQNLPKYGYAKPKIEIFDSSKLLGFQK